MSSQLDNKIFLKREDQQPVYSFSGARNPTTQAVFGLYSPMPNASVVKLSYELNVPVSATWPFV